MLIKDSRNTKLPFAIKLLLTHPDACKVAAAVIGGVVSAGVGAMASTSAASTEANAQTNAANEQLQATQETNQLNYQIYENNLANLSPQMQVQQEAESALASGFGLGTPNSGANQLGLGGNTSSGGQSPVGPGSMNYATYASPNSFQATSQGTPTTPAVSGTGGSPAMSTAQGISVSNDHMMMPTQTPLGTGTSTSPATGQWLGRGGSSDGTGSAPNAVYGQQTPGTTQGGGSSTGTGLNGIGTGSLLTPGASQGQLNSGASSQSSGSLLANFNNTDLNSQLAPNMGFITAQGSLGLQNYDAAHGISGGNAVNSQTQYLTNTASGFYQQAFQNYLTQQQQNISNLSGLANGTAVGQAVGAGTSAGSTIAGTTAAGVNAYTGLQTGAASSTAAGTIGIANAVNGGIGSATSGALMSKLLQGQQSPVTPTTPTPVQQNPNYGSPGDDPDGLNYFVPGTGTG
jgi:hypothetical protein